MALAAAPPAALLLLLLLILLSTPTAHSRPYLTTAYYRRSCPRFEQIVQDVTTNKQISSPTTAAGALRLFFHDCFVRGCDASVLLSSTRSISAERDSDINLSLPGDAFDLIVRAKTALELSCPGTVSCSDILALSVRNLVVMLGGPYYSVKYGRRDSRVSRAADVPGNLPTPAMPMDQLIHVFQSKNFSIQEMVALSGSHTIGFSHCKEFSSILYNYSRTQQSDPAYYPDFSQALRNACKDYKSNPTLSVFNDVMTPGKFDNLYYSNALKGLGVLKSDHVMSSDPRTRGYMEWYAKDQNAFFRDFARAMEKLSEYGVLTGRQGEIRRRCDAIN